MVGGKLGGEDMLWLEVRLEVLSKAEVGVSM